MPEQAAINIDETGHPENGKKLWTWGFHVPGSQGFTWFHVDPSRSSDVLYEFLGDAFSGVIGCDYYSVYRKFLAETDKAHPTMPRTLLPEPRSAVRFCLLRFG